MCIVKDGPDVSVFNHPGALTKLALWIGEALAEQEKESTGRLSNKGRGTPLVAASLDEKRGVYIVVGTGGGGGGADLPADKKKKAEEKRAKAKAREESRKAKERIREEKRAARRAAGADDEEETESEGSEGSDDDEDSSEDEDDGPKERGHGLNRFGNAFQDVVTETNARIRIDSFEHCVVEVKKEDLGGFLESLSMKAVVG